MSDRHDIIDTAVAADSFKTMAAASTAAGLVDRLKGTGPYTVSAPTGDAFAKLPDGTVAALLRDAPRLEAILTHHVASGKVCASPRPTSTAAMAWSMRSMWSMRC